MRFDLFCFAIYSSHPTVENIAKQRGKIISSTAWKKKNKTVSSVFLIKQTEIVYLGGRYNLLLCMWKNSYLSATYTFLGVYLRMCSCLLGCCHSYAPPVYIYVLVFFQYCSLRLDRFCWDRSLHIYNYQNIRLTRYKTDLAWVCELSYGTRCLSYRLLTLAKSTITSTCSIFGDYSHSESMGKGSRCWTSVRRIKKNNCTSRRWV